MDATGPIYRREPSDPGEPVFLRTLAEARQRVVHRDGRMFGIARDTARASLSRASSASRTAPRRRSWTSCGAWQSWPPAGSGCLACRQPRAFPERVSLCTGGAAGELGAGFSEAVFSITVREILFGVRSPGRVPAATAPGPGDTRQGARSRNRLRPCG